MIQFTSIFSARDLTIIDCECFKQPNEGQQAHLDRNGVEGLVHAFYTDVRADPLPGPVLARAI